MHPELANDQSAERALSTHQSSSYRRHRSYVMVLGIILLVGVILYGWWLTTAPPYQGERSIIVTPGETVSEVVAAAKAAGIVRSETVLYLLTQFSYADETIQTGTYTFTSAADVFTVAKQLMLTTPRDELIAITFPEGITAVAMSEIAAAELPEFATSTFLALAKEAEGTLWPETYFVPTSYTAPQLFELLTESHRQAMAERAAAIDSHELTTNQIITLASILEREANDAPSMRMVAGILLNRLESGMPLQADATIEYVLDTPLHELPPGALAAELRELDSPYNTYRSSGLPPTPIANPGQQAIDAVLDPTPSDYFFYITAPDGTFHYAETYEQHLVNIERYLR